MSDVILGIVGAAEEKFTTVGMKQARLAIANNIQRFNAAAICSGHCHMGGVDIWTEEAARYIGGSFWEKSRSLIFPPSELGWKRGYMPRNVKIAQASTILVNIVVDQLPPGFKGMTHKLCYHCTTRGDTQPHVKSGGCWTMWYAREKFRKHVVRVVVKNFGGNSSTYEFHSGTLQKYQEKFQGGLFE